MKVLVFQADHREPLEEFPCAWLTHPFLRAEDTFEVVDCLQATPQLNLKQYDAFLMTGSRFQPGDDLPWIYCLRAQVETILELGKPFLGICFGHQLLGEVIGAKVVKHPKGIEAGTVKVELTEAGKAERLFAGVPERFPVFSYHNFEVQGLAVIKGAALLAGNAHSEVQAFRYGDNAWGVQFHPEVDLGRAHKVIQYRKERRDDSTLDFDALASRLQDMPAGEQIMSNFFQGWTGVDRGDGL